MVWRQGHDGEVLSVLIALTLAAEAMGRELYLPPEQHTDLVLTVLDLLESGLSEADVLPVAQRIVRRKAYRGQGNEHSHKVEDADR